MKEEKFILPTHVGIIMDGNRRWAKERKLSGSLGHKAGVDNLKKLLVHIFDRGIRYVSVYAFSTENFKREQKEVDYLMNLFRTYFRKEFQEIIDRNVKVVFSGRRENIPDSVWDSMKYLEDQTRDGKNGILNICLNYGGQYEILDMTKKVCQLVLENKISIDQIDLSVIEENLYQKIPAVDLMIRTSGEFRISNFMLYQTAYAEYYFPTTYFPDFNDEHFEQALLEYNKRNRRFGGN